MKSWILLFLSPLYITLTWVDPGIYAQDVTIGTGTSSTTNFPFRGLYEDERVQIIWTSSELSTAGMVTDGILSAIKFEIGTKGSTAPYKNFTVKLAHTSSSTFSTANFLNETFTTVKNGHDLTTVASSWNTISFDVNFIWNGTDNIIAELCYDNTAYTANDNTKYTSTAGSTVCYNRSDNASGCSLSAVYLSSLRPNVKFTHTAPTTTTWDGSESTDWGDANNWSSGLPSSSTKVVIPSGLSNYPDFDESSDFSMLDLTVNSGATLTFSDNDNHIIIDRKLINNGTITHTGSGYFKLTGATILEKGGSATNTTLKIQVGSVGTITQNSAVVDIYDLNILSGGNYVLGSNTLKAYKFDLNGTFNCGSGTLQLEGSSSDIDFSGGSLSAGSGMVHFNSGDVWSAVNQTVPSTTYNDLKVSVANGYTVIVGNGSNVIVNDDIIFANPGSAGGQINVNNDVVGNTSLSIGATGNALTLNLAARIYRSSGEGTFTMGNVSGHQINVSYASSTLNVIDGFGSMTFYGTVDFTSNSAQRIPTATFNNLTCSGTGTKNPELNLDVNGNLNIASGATLNTFRSDAPALAIETGAFVGTGYIFKHFWEDARTQIIYTAAELTANGFVAGDIISAIQFNVSTKNSTTEIANLAISVGHTTTGSFANTTFLSPTFTSCRNAADFTTAVGWNNMAFDNNFTWNGTDNIIIQMCHDDDSYTENDQVFLHSTASNMILFGEKDNDVGCSLPGETRDTYRPDIRFTITRNVQSNVTLAGNWNDSGTFTYGTGSVTLDGGSTQTIAGNTTFYKLTLNNGSGANVSSGLPAIKHTLYLTSGELNTNGSLKFVSDANLTARINEISGGSIAGNITFERYVSINADGWRMISSPCSGRTVQDWQDDFVTAGFPGSDYPSFSFISMYTYNETTLGAAGQGYEAPSSNTDVLGVGEGFYTYLGTGNVTIDVTGPANTGNISLPVTFTDDPAESIDEDGWNLVGNPYPSAIDWDAPSGWTKTNMNDAIYVYKASEAQFASYIAGVGANGGTRYIASTQGFWVKANAASPVLNVTEAVKSTEDPTFFKSEDFPVLLRLSLSGNNLTDDEMVVRFHEEGTYDYQGEWDALKIMSNNPSQAVNITTELNNTEYSINTIPLYKQSHIIPVNIYVPLSGTYNIRADELPFAPTINCLLLKDLETGDVVNLMEDSVYTFSADNNTINPRFEILVYAPAEVEITNTNCFNDENGTIGITPLGNGTFNLNVFENGVLIFSDTNSTDSFEVNNLPSNWYVLELTGSGNCANELDSVFVGQPGVLVSDAESGGDEGMNNGWINLSVTGGTPPYQYMWNPAQTGNNFIDQLTYGTYAYTVLDANGCSIDGEIDVLYTVGLDEKEMLNFIAYPSPVSQQLNLQFTEFVFQVDVNIYDLNGKLLLAEPFYVKELQAIQIDMSQFQYGSYLLVVTEYGSSEQIIGRKSIQILKGE